MMHIMKELQDRYVPKKVIDTPTLNCEVFHKVLMGGDQLTVARCRGAHMGRKNETTPSEQLRGLVPVIEDWHAKQCFLEVCAHAMKDS
jgi:L1 cell adhesion molecule like protein